MAGGANASCSAEVTDRSRSSNPNGPGIRMQFKQPVTKNLHYDNPLEKNVSIFYLLCSNVISIRLYSIFLMPWYINNLMLLNWQCYFGNSLLKLPLAACKWNIHALHFSCTCWNLKKNRTKICFAFWRYKPHSWKRKQSGSFK